MPSIAPSPLTEPASPGTAVADILGRLSFVNLFYGNGVSARQLVYDACDEISRLRARVAELEKDAARLDYADTLCEAYGVDYHEGNRWELDGPFNSIRSAIDAYMESVLPTSMKA